jgi:hypothetical protein
MCAQKNKDKDLNCVLILIVVLLIGVDVVQRARVVRVPWNGGAMSAFLFFASRLFSVRDDDTGESVLLIILGAVQRAGVVRVACSRMKSVKIALQWRYKGFTRTLQ